MDLQETVESLRKVIEGAVAPSIRDIQTRLDGLDKSMQGLQGEIRDTNARVERLDTRMESRFDAMDTRMESRFDAMDTRMDGGMAELRGEIRAVNGRFDTLMTAILNMRQPSYPDSVLARLEQVEKSIQDVTKGR